MKVLFAIGNAQTSKGVADKYYQTYGEKLEYKDDSFKYTFTPRNKKIYYLVILNDGE